MATRVVVHGALGRIGQEVIQAVEKAPDLLLVGAADSAASKSQLELPGGRSIPLASSLEQLSVEKPDVIVDFSNAGAAVEAIRYGAERGINLVVGSTGFSSDDIARIGELARLGGIGIFMASNFALGAVLMMHLSKIVSRHMDSAEIIELHHDQKLDSPSGTAVATARAMLAARGKSFNSPANERPSESRGKEYDGIAIHSVRLPGLMAHQEVIFGAPGQTLTIRHDTINRSCYIPGVLLAIRRVGSLKGLVVGLENLLGLGEIK